MQPQPSREVIGRLDVDLLSALIAVHETGGVTRAAERLNRTQPAVSMQLRRLEQRVGKPLIERMHRRLRLTPHGEELMPYAKRIVSLCEEARERMAMPRLTGTARIGIPEWFATDRLQAVLCRFSRLHPSVRLDIEVGPSVRLRELLHGGRLQLALAICVFFDTTGEQVWREPLHWVSARNLPVEERDQVPLALFHDPCPYRDLAISNLNQAGRSWREAFTSSSVSTVRAAVLSGLGVSIFPAGAITDDLRILGPKDGFAALPPTELSIYTARGDLPDPVVYLAQYLADYVTEALSPYANVGTFAEAVNA